ncbi:MAG TPA: radical SAM family heme chaperone HemW, partial [Candidatus Limnocylindrales bacterium]|nr:radical SAM family heme chaperone HemW [Candidatus Limnocylindrales bacterium]
IAADRNPLYAAHPIPRRDGVPRGAGALGQPRSSLEISLYVHIPFCAARCPYCDFATAPATSRLRARYLEALATEIRREGAMLGRPRVRTLYYGGGTPSLLEPGEIAVLADALRSSFELAPAEATVEANPATLDRARLDAWRAAGITRISLGAQSLTAAGLAALARTHQPEDTAAAVDAARSAGLDVSIDLIFGWAGQTLDAWRADLEAAVGLRPDHISCYPLELAMEPEESSTNWPGAGWESVRRWRATQTAVQPGDEEVARMYRIAERALRDAGFRHYEIANWARPGKRCEHNLAYWRNGEWLGLGTGAHSHLGGVRSRRPASVVAYIAAIEAGDARIAEGAADDAADTAMLALRLDEGLDLDAYAARFGHGAAERVRASLGESAGLGLVRFVDHIARLTPRGRLLASEVFVRLLPDDDVLTSPQRSLALAAT